MTRQANHINTQTGQSWQDRPIMITHRQTNHDCCELHSTLLLITDATVVQDIINCKKTQKQLRHWNHKTKQNKTNKKQTTAKNNHNNNLFPPPQNLKSYSCQKTKKQQQKPKQNNNKKNQNQTNNMPSWKPHTQSKPNRLAKCNTKTFFTTFTSLFDHHDPSSQNCPIPNI